MISKATCNEISQKIISKRNNFAKSRDLDSFWSILDRRILSRDFDRKNKESAILYWMIREQRLEDNHALLWVQNQANQLCVPFYIGYAFDYAIFPQSQDRHFLFLLSNLKSIIDQCDAMNFNFLFEKGSTRDILKLWCDQLNITTIVTDYSPLKEILNLQNDLKKDLHSSSKSCKLIVIDSHNIVPPWIVTDRFESKAKTMRRKIFSIIFEYLTEFPNLACSSRKFRDDKIIENSKKRVNKCIALLDENQKIPWANPGFESALNILYYFFRNKMPCYLHDKLIPTKNCVSNISPWLHFGHISTQRVVNECLDFGNENTISNHIDLFNKTSLNLFLDQLILCKEMAENFCHFAQDYTDPCASAPSWAFKTLYKHRNDPREYIYSLKDLEEANTHDDLWNAAQMQMIKEAKMHGFMRLYWSKKILEWTKSINDAAKYSIYLNNKYSLDGSDPNGYKGIMWSLVGLNDYPFCERNIFGTVRYMSNEGCKRKFPIKSYIDRFIK